MNEINYFAAFLIGLLGSTHCIGMCGGIVGALTMGLPDNVRQSPVKLLPYLLIYNTGRLLSYAFAGLLIGLITASASSFFQIGKFPIGGIVGGLFMIALGIYIAGWFQTMAPLEKLGGHFWRVIEPFGRKLMPVKTLPHAFGLGLLWGWLPCGMVYSGTLPMLLAMGGLAEKLQRITRNKKIRYFAGIILIAFGALILSKALSGGHQHANHQNMQQSE
jgi:sulfite exporter TauE/SafE